MPTTATLLRFPPRVRFSALHWFHAERGRGGVVAVFFQVTFDHTEHRRAHHDQDQQQRCECEEGTQP